MVQNDAKRLIFNFRCQITVLEVISSASTVNQNNKIVYFDREIKLHFSSQLVNKVVNMKRFHVIKFTDWIMSIQWPPKGITKTSNVSKLITKSLKKAEETNLVPNYTFKDLSRISVSHLPLHLDIENPIPWLLYQKDEIHWDQGFPKCLFHN